MIDDQPIYEDDEELDEELTWEEVMNDLDEDEEEDENTRPYIQWNLISGMYIPTGKVNLRKSVPAGLYDVRTHSRYGYYLSKKRIKTDGIVKLPIKAVEEIIKDIQTFWESEAQFKEYKLSFKRGIMMVGPQGCGKTYTINRIIQHLIRKKNGIVFRIETAGNLDSFYDFVSGPLRMLEPKRPIVCIIEDIDGMVESRNNEAKLLNVLDGNKSLDNIVFIATSNFPENLNDRLLRPSRFDRIHELGYPEAEVRKAFFEQKLKPKDLKKIDMEKWVKETEGLTISHLREIIGSTMCLGHTFDATIEYMKKAKDKKKKSSDWEQKGNIGFTPSS